MSIFKCLLVFLKYLAILKIAHRTRLNESKIPINRKCYVNDTLWTPCNLHNSAICCAFAHIIQGTMFLFNILLSSDQVLFADVLVECGSVCVVSRLQWVLICIHGGNGLLLLEGYFVANFSVLFNVFIYEGVSYCIVGYTRFPHPPSLIWSLPSPFFLDLISSRTISFLLSITCRLYVSELTNAVEYYRANLEPFTIVIPRVTSSPTPRATPTYSGNITD